MKIHTRSSGNFFAHFCPPGTQWFELFYLLKVSKFQNEFMKSSFLPKYKPNFVWISVFTVPHYRAEILTIFVHILGETVTSKIDSEIYWPLAASLLYCNLTIAWWIICRLKCVYNKRKAPLYQGGFYWFNEK